MGVPAGPTGPTRNVTYPAP